MRGGMKKNEGVGRERLYRLNKGGKKKRSKIKGKTAPHGDTLTKYLSEIKGENRGRGDYENARRRRPRGATNSLGKVLGIRRKNREKKSSPGTSRDPALSKKRGHRQSFAKSTEKKKAHRRKLKALAPYGGEVRAYSNISRAYENFWDGAIKRRGILPRR